MTRTLNLAVAIVAFLALIIVLYGGVGAFLAFGPYGEGLSAHWPWVAHAWPVVAIIWAITWLFGIVASLVRARVLWSRIGQRKSESWQAADVVVAAGHVVLIAALVLVAAPWPWTDFVYFGLILAGMFYAAGVGMFAVIAVPARAVE